MLTTKFLAMEWKRVSRKGFRKIAVQRHESHPLGGGFNQKGVEGIQSIYFSEIPDRVKAEEIFNLFDLLVR